jgi:hypothetical protein
VSVWLEPGVRDSKKEHFPFFISNLPFVIVGSGERHVSGWLAMKNEKCDMSKWKIGFPNSSDLT